MKEGWTALHFAAKKGSKEIVEILIEHGASIHLQNEVLIFFFWFIDLLDCGRMGKLGELRRRMGLEWFLYFLFFLFLIRLVKQSLMLQKIRALLNPSSNWRFHFFLSLLFLAFFLSILMLFFFLVCRDEQSNQLK